MKISKGIATYRTLEYLGGVTSVYDSSSDKSEKWKIKA